MKKFRQAHSLLLLLAAVLILGSCGRKTPSGAAMYYWKSTFTLDSAQRAFIGEHDIKTLYIKFFDVAGTDSTAPAPVATLTFKDSLPDEVNYVPVVYITNECFATNRSDMAGLIVKRVRDMAETNDFPAPEEIQIDCDWSQSTRANFFTFMDSVRVHADRAEMRVSVTVRLHQLRDEAPNADYGVLMVYNTGDVRNPDGHNPILSKEAVEPYLKNLKDYSLPLCAAYPNFNWPVIYSPAEDGKLKFRALLYGANPAEQPFMFQPDGKGDWVTIRSMRFDTAIGSKSNVIRVVPGEKVKVITPPPFDTLLEIEKAIGKNSSGINNRIILYDINPLNLNIYTADEYDKIFNP